MIPLKIILFLEKKTKSISAIIVTEISGINKLKDNFNLSTDKDIGEQGNKISGGQRQRV